jgi:hypothetical protein
MGDICGAAVHVANQTEFRSFEELVPACADPKIEGVSKRAAREAFACESQKILFVNAQVAHSEQYGFWNSIGRQTNQVVRDALVAGQAHNEP